MIFFLSEYKSLYVTLILVWETDQCHLSPSNENRKACFCTTHFALMAFFTTLPQFALILFALIALHFCLDVIALTVLFLSQMHYFLKVILHLSIASYSFYTSIFLDYLFAIRGFFSVLVFALIPTTYYYISLSA